MLVKTSNRDENKTSCSFHAAHPDGEGSYLMATRYASACGASSKPEAWPGLFRLSCRNAKSRLKLGKTSAGIGIPCILQGGVHRSQELQLGN